MKTSDLDALEKLLAAATPPGRVMGSDAALMIALRNHAPALLAAAREAERLRAALEMSIRTGGCRGCAQDAMGPDGTAQHTCDAGERHVANYGDLVSAISAHEVTIGRLQTRNAALEKVAEAARRELKSEWATLGGLPHLTAALAELDALKEKT